MYTCAAVTKSLFGLSRLAGATWVCDWVRREKRTNSHWAQTRWCRDSPRWSESRTGESEPGYQSSAGTRLVGCPQWTHRPRDPQAEEAAKTKGARLGSSSNEWNRIENPRFSSFQLSRDQDSDAHRKNGIGKKILDSWIATFLLAMGENRTLFGQRQQIDLKGQEAGLRVHHRHSVKYWPQRWNFWMLWSTVIEHHIGLFWNGTDNKKEGNMNCWRCGLLFELGKKSNVMKAWNLLREIRKLELCFCVQTKFGTFNPIKSEVNGSLCKCTAMVWLPCVNTSVRHTFPKEENRKYLVDFNLMCKWLNPEVVQVIKIN